MHKGIFPIFTKGRIIKKEALEYMRDFPYDFANIAFDSYSDGILFGFSIKYKNESIFISKGAFKFENEIIITDDYNLSIDIYGRILYIILFIGNEEQDLDYKRRPINIFLSTELPNNKNEFELARFILNKGAILRCEYDSFEDLNTTNNTLNIINSPYSGYEYQTLNPIIMKKFAHDILLISTDSIDINFAYICLSSNIIFYDIILWFIANKMQDDYKKIEISMIYEKLYKILSMINTKPIYFKQKKSNRPTII